MPRTISKPKVCVQAMVSERQRDQLIEEARRRDLSLSELIRRALEEVVAPSRETRNDG